MLYIVVLHPSNQLEDTNGTMTMLSNELAHDMGIPATL